jgi:hypothetical protein
LVRLVIVTNIQTRCWRSRRLCMGEIHAGSRGRGGKEGGEGAAAAAYAAGGGQSTMTRLPPFLRLRLRHHVRDIMIFLPIFHPVPFRVRCEVKMNESCRVKATFDLKTLRQDPLPHGEWGRPTTAASEQKPYPKTCALSTRKIKPILAPPHATHVSDCARPRVYRRQGHTDGPWAGWEPEVRW